MTVSLRQARQWRLSVLAGLGLCLVLAVLASLHLGYARLDPLALIRVLAGEGSGREELILFTFRLPRILVAMGVGAGLALSGCILQGVSRNELADPGLLGINAGAGFAVILFGLLFPVDTPLAIFSLPLLALAGGGAAAAAVYGLAYRQGQGVAPLRLVLTGVAVQAGISAAMIVLTIMLDENQFDFMAVWLMGHIGETSLSHAAVLGCWLLALIPYVWRKARVLDLLAIGEEAASGLGVAVKRERRGLLAAAAALAAVCVAVGGSISFVGLAAPHLARRMTGPAHRLTLPGCALTGALLLVAADAAARTIAQPAELATGIVVAIIGAPYFLLLLGRSRG
ncbi:MAG: iron ABC transporter permease [Sporomusaceae bacterium]|nr:iron ABC transporter permease [Sporomusaceae bacterium]